MSSTSLKINGREHVVDVDPDCPLLYVLRDNLSMNNPRFGCGLGQCGACTVLVDDRAVRSCTLPVSRAAGKEIVTLEGLMQPEGPDPVQTAFIEEQAFQCGYCLNGWVLTTKALLERKTPSHRRRNEKRVPESDLPLRQPHADFRRRAPRRGRNERERISHGSENWTVEKRIRQGRRRPADRLQPGWMPVSCRRFWPRHCRMPPLPRSAQPLGCVAAHREGRQHSRLHWQSRYRHGRRDRFRPDRCRRARCRTRQT